jgi:putative oxidoreductase
MGALQKFVQTSPLVGPLLLRITLAVVMFPHGAQKVLGWYGGHGFSATMQSFTQNMNIPAPFAFLAILTEFAGPIALLVGFLTRLSAFGMAAVMAVAALKVHAANGFFMNWMGSQKGEGFEYHILAFGIAVALLVMGAGCCSIDRLLSKKYVQ